MLKDLQQEGLVSTPPLVEEELQLRRTMMGEWGELDEKAWNGVDKKEGAKINSILQITCARLTSKLSSWSIEVR
jgi:hypothetical protein